MSAAHCAALRTGAIKRLRPPALIDYDNAVEAQQRARKQWSYIGAYDVDPEYKGRGLQLEFIVDIVNATLRDFCNLKGQRLNGTYAFPWNEMRDNITCSRERLNEYRWLLLHATRLPSTSADRWRYAQGIAKTLQADQCVHPDLQVFVLNFLQQK
jgi:hypothetical protein